MASKYVWRLSVAGSESWYRLEWLSGPDTLGLLSGKKIEFRATYKWDCKCESLIALTAPDKIPVLSDPPGIECKACIGPNVDRETNCQIHCYGFSVSSSIEGFSGFYTGQIFQLGYDVTGMFSNGTVAVSLHGGGGVMVIQFNDPTLHHDPYSHACSYVYNADPGCGQHFRFMLAAGNPVNWPGTWSPYIDVWKLPEYICDQTPCGAGNCYYVVRSNGATPPTYRWSEAGGICGPYRPFFGTGQGMLSGSYRQCPNCIPAYEVGVRYGQPTEADYNLYGSYDYPGGTYVIGRKDFGCGVGLGSGSGSGSGT